MFQNIVESLVKYDVAVPRYTSYPTAPEWQPLLPQTYAERLKAQGQKNLPLSLYFHIPFCHTMCLFCACAVVLNRKPENEERYVEYLCKEIDLVAGHLGGKKVVRQLHFGGGTPTKLSPVLIRRLYNKICDAFVIASDAEIAIEIDPRTVFEDQGQKLQLLKDLGFHRVSFGVQDTNAAVQEAVRRRQSYEMTKYTFDLARKIGFQGINIDLIYGLPLQTKTTFSDTIDKIVDMRPDRIALFSYAKVPWMKEHQKAIRDADLPSVDEKFAIYASAREKLTSSGYRAIGMDHFALETDELSLAYEKKRLQRNFQGYTVLDVDDLIGFGVTSIGYVQNCYVQNGKELAGYYKSLDEGELAAFRGKVLHQDDLMRRWVIQRLMCDFRLQKESFFQTYGQDFDQYFERELVALEPFVQNGFVIRDPAAILVTKEGELFVRNITSVFDWYLAQKEGHRSFSKAI